MKSGETDKSRLPALRGWRHAPTPRKPMYRLPVANYSGDSGDFTARMLPRSFPLAVFAAHSRPALCPRASNLRPQPASEDYVRAHYTKYEYRIPMRDGKRLFTAVYVPKDAAGGPYPVFHGPHALQRGSLRRRPVSGAPRARRTSSRKPATSLSTRMCAGAG